MRDTVELVQQSLLAIKHMDLKAFAGLDPRDKEIHDHNIDQLVRAAGGLSRLKMLPETLNGMPQYSTGDEIAAAMDAAIGDGGVFVDMMGAWPRMPQPEDPYFDTDGAIRCAAAFVGRGMDPFGVAPNQPGGLCFVIQAEPGQHWKDGLVLPMGYCGADEVEGGVALLDWPGRLDEEQRKCLMGVGERALRVVEHHLRATLTPSAMPFQLGGGKVQ